MSTDFAFNAFPDGSGFDPFSQIPGVLEPGMSSLFGAAARGTRGEGEDAASLDAYESMLGGSLVEHRRDQVTGVFANAFDTRRADPAGGAEGSATSRGAGPFQAEIASEEHFAIAHPRWGLLDVDSRRTSSAWDVVVRCGDERTRRSLREREHELREVLGREFGVTLELDAQPAARS